MFGAQPAAGGFNPNKDFQIPTPLGDSVSSLSFSPRANLLIATCWDNNVYCWDIQVRARRPCGFGQALRHAGSQARHGWQLRPALAPRSARCGRRVGPAESSGGYTGACCWCPWPAPLAAASFPRLALTRVDPCACRPPLRPQPNGTANPKASTNHTQPVLCSAWNGDGTGVFTGGCDKMVKLWNLATNQSQQVRGRRVATRDTRPKWQPLFQKGRAPAAGTCRGDLPRSLTPAARACGLISTAHGPRRLWVRRHAAGHRACLAPRPPHTLTASRPARPAPRPPPVRPGGGARRARAPLRVHPGAQYAGHGRMGQDAAVGGGTDGAGLDPPPMHSRWHPRVPAEPCQDQAAGAPLRRAPSQAAASAPPAPAASSPITAPCCLPCPTATLPSTPEPPPPPPPPFPSPFPA
jgi:hypothetical protein